MKKRTAFTIFFGALLAIPASATTTWNFETNSGNQVQSDPGTFTVGGTSIQAWGFDNYGTAQGLYQTTNGMGVAIGPFGQNNSYLDCEINQVCYVVFDISNLALGSNVTLTLYNPNHDTYEVYQSNGPGDPPSGPAPNQPGSNYTTPPTGGANNPTGSSYTFTRSDSDTFVAIELPTKDSYGSSVLVQSLTGTAAAPEPVYYSLLAFGLTVLGFAARFRGRKVSN